jgi:hypothetical protein
MGGGGKGAVPSETAPWDRIFFDFLPVHTLSTAVLYGPHHRRKDIHDRKITVPKHAKVVVYLAKGGRVSLKVLYA